MGLSQVYGIVKQHEGHVDVRSEVGQSSAFSLYLPVLQLVKQQVADLESGELLRGRGERILVVEDEHATRRALKDSLTLLGYQVFMVENGNQALSHLKEHIGEIGLILCDVVMPQMGGIALFHALQEMKYRVPLVLMTGHPMEEELGKLQSEGLLAWMLKPVQLKQLAQVVAKILGAK